VRRWRELLRGYAGEGQRLLWTLINRRLDFTPIERRFYRFKGIGTLAPVLAGVLPHVPHNMASPTGSAKGCNHPFVGWAA
jgi:hypothetical protein